MLIVIQHLAEQKCRNEDKKRRMCTIWEFGWSFALTAGSHDHSKFQWQWGGGNILGRLHRSVLVGWTDVFVGNGDFNMFAGVCWRCSKLTLGLGVGAVMSQGWEIWAGILRANTKNLMVSMWGCPWDSAEGVGFLSVFNLALCCHIVWNLMSRLQVLKSGSNKQWNWRLASPICVLSIIGTMCACSGGWHKKMSTLDLSDHLLWYFWLCRDDSNTYTGEPKCVKFYKFGSTSNWKNLDIGNELYLEVTMLILMRWEAMKLVGSEFRSFV